MSFDYNAYQRKFPYKVISGQRDRRPIPRIECADGFSFSVQADAYKYCAPRETGLSNYRLVEVGYPSEHVESLMPYAEDADDPTGTVYGFVPVALIEEIVNARGGIVAARTTAATP